MVLIETVSKKQKSETPRPRSQKFENPRRKETQENEISRPIQNASEISRLEQNFPSTWIFRVPFATPYIYPLVIEFYEVFSVTQSFLLWTFGNENPKVRV